MNSDVLHTLFTDPALITEIQKHSRTKAIEKDTVMMSGGDDIVFIPIVKTGVLRIIRQNDEGNEVFLYFLFPGETCALSMSCSQAHKRNMVKAVAEDDTTVMLIPVKNVDEWTKYPQWKNYIYNTYSKRFAELIDVIDLIAFNNMDKQVMHYLQQRAKAMNTAALYITHQQIADELHTQREAISRLLRSMEQKNMVKLGRNIIELCTPYVTNVPNHEYSTQ